MTSEISEIGQSDFLSLDIKKTFPHSPSESDCLTFLLDSNYAPAGFIV